jgi:hypothetical protein
MQLFQILGSVVLLSVAAYYMYNAFANMYFVQEFDKYGRRHKRDVRNGRFVRVK